MATSSYLSTAQSGLFSFIFIKVPAFSAVHFAIGNFVVVHIIKACRISLKYQEHLVISDIVGFKQQLFYKYLRSII